ncbi:hypothetical protein ABZ780_05385 [Micromonospora sp. NPDC047467]|uniref:hypothetical protein n=1 Tax=Micromonospora sp. NPDC047467 TaxID=3154814 RepID=UPI00340E9448
MTTTSTYSYTRVHTATHLTEVILGSIGDILADLGINAGPLHARWKTNENAIKAWIAEGSLAAVVLECQPPTGQAKPVIEFPVAYTTTGGGDAEFTASRARLARFRAKLDRVPAGTTFRLVCTFSGTHTAQPGWSTTTRASTAGLQSLTFGTVGTAPHASASLRYHH